MTGIRGFSARSCSKIVNEVSKRGGLGNTVLNAPQHRDDSGYKTIKHSKEVLKAISTKENA